MKVNFGKYIGKNIQVLLNDIKYCEWLLKQSFIKEKYPKIYDSIINYKPLRKLNYNDLPDDIIEYINEFNALEKRYRGGKYLPIYYPIKKIIVDKGSLVMRCKAEKYITGFNAGKILKDYSWGYTNCLNCGIKIANDDSNSYYFLCNNCNCNRNKRKIPPQLHDENTTNNIGVFGMPVIKNNNIVRVNEIPDFCLID